jgi:hypothetical protein
MLIPANRWGMLVKTPVSDRLTRPATILHESILSKVDTRRGWWIAGALLVLTIALVVSLILHFGNPDSWPEARCTVAGSRVIRADVADSFRAIVLYRGEYQLRYSVGGQDYYLWASSGWADPDRAFV